MAEDSKKKSKEAKKDVAAEAAPAATPASAFATAKYVRVSPRKMRLVADMVRGHNLAKARSILAFSTKACAKVVDKAIASAAANAENNHDLSGDELYVKSIFVNEGPTIKRFRPRAMGRAARIRKRTSHLTVELAERKEA